VAKTGDLVTDWDSHERDKPVLKFRCQPRMWGTFKPFGSRTEVRIRDSLS
jgi:hypothetical protein